MPGVIFASALAASWIIVGVYALLPTFLVAILAVKDNSKRSSVFPFGWIVFCLLILGGALRIPFEMGVLSPVEDWLSFVVSSRPAQTTLAAKVLAGEDKAAGIYLMMVLGEISMAICILTLASRPGIYAATIHYYHDDFASNPSVKRGRLGLFFFVMPFMFCWVLIKTTGEGNIDYFSCFFPGFYIFAPISLSLGWQMLFVDADPHKDQSRH